MLISTLAVVIFGLDADPKEVLKSVRDRYRSLTSFSMTIDHEDSSGLYPGKYSQSLQWRKDGRFELLVTKKAGHQPATGSGNAVPNFYASNGAVSNYLEGKLQNQRSLSPEINVVPAWEVCGGLILSWLQRTPTGDLLFSPPKEIEFKYEFGNDTEWQKMKVVEILATYASQGSSSTASIFLDSGAKQLVGMQWKLAGDTKVHSVAYRDQNFEPVLPATLGNPPK